VNVLFDLDGTLTDPGKGIVACIRYALSALGESTLPESDLGRFIGPPLRDTFSELLSADSTRVEVAIAAYRERFTEIGMFENSVYEGIPSVLEWLAVHDVRLFVATSKPRVFAERILDHFELSKYFSAVYGSELSGELSDKGDLIGYALATSGLRPADTSMVGDRCHDVRGALRNHVSSAGVLWGYGSRDELMAAGVERLFQEPCELAQLLVAAKRPK